MLSALIQSEAAIVALVVTLSLVAVQLAAQSYSARVIEVFRRTPDLWILMGIYGVAIFYGLGVLKMIENPLDGRLSNLEGNIAFSYYLGVFAFVALVPYMWNTLEMLKPSTVIKVLSEEITKGNILSAIKDNSLKPNERDPIQPIIDIVRGSMMKYDYETIREGLIAIEEQTKHIIENKNFEKDEKENIAQHVFFHLERVGKLAVSRKDEDSVLEVICNLNDIGISASNQKLERAALKAVESLGVIGKNVAEQKLENATLSVIDSLRWVGKSAAKQELTDAAQWAAESLGAIGEIAAKKEIKEAISWVSVCLEELGKVAVEYKLEYAAQQVAMHLGLIGKVAAEHKLEDATCQTASSLRGIGIAAAEKNLGYVTYQAAFSLKEDGIEAANHKLVKTLLHIVKCTEEVLKAAKDNKLHEVPQVEEFFQIINEALSKSEKK
jgi:hypothetical protein